MSINALDLDTQLLILYSSAQDILLELGMNDETSEILTERIVSSYKDRYKEMHDKMNSAEELRDIREALKEARG